MSICFEAIFVFICSVYPDDELIGERSDGRESLFAVISLVDGALVNSDEDSSYVFEDCYDS